MKQIKIKTLGFSANYQVTENAAEFDAQPGVEQGACHAEAVQNVLYRGVLTDLREALCEWLETKTGVLRTRETRTNKDGSTVEVIVQSAGQYARQLTEDGAMPDSAEVSSYLQSLCDSSEYAFAAYCREPERRVAAPKARRVPKAILTEVEQIIASGKGELLAAKVGQSLGRTITLPEDRSKWAEVLGLAIREDEEREIQRMRAQRIQV